MSSDTVPLGTFPLHLEELAASCRGMILAVGGRRLETRLAGFVIRPEADWVSSGATDSGLSTSEWPPLAGECTSGCESVPGYARFERGGSA